MWIPKTLDDALIQEADALDLDPEYLSTGILNEDITTTPDLFITFTKRRMAKLEYQCICGLFRNPALMIDVRQHGNIPQDWACDGCWSTWQRQGIYFNVNGKPPKDRHEWLTRWVKSHGAPAEVLDKIQNNRPVEEYGEIRGRKIKV